MSHVVPFPSPAETIDPEELLWYFQERFTDAGPGSVDRAESIQSRLSNLGRALFHTVFEADPQCRDILASAISQGLSEFTLAVVSNQAEFLNLPWELLNHSDLGYLARQLHSVVRPDLRRPLERISSSAGRCPVQRTPGLSIPIASRTRPRRFTRKPRRRNGEGP